MRWGRERRAQTQLLCAFALACGLLAPLRSARGAEPVRIERLLRVEPGVTCLTSEQLAPEVERWLGDVEIGGEIAIVVDGSAFDPRHVRVLVVRDKRTVAERAFEPGPESCESLHSAVALAIAIALKASQTEAPAERPTDPEQPTTPAPEPAPRWSLAGFGLAAFRLLPELAPGLELSLRARLSEHFGLRAGALGVVALGVPIAPQPGSFDATLAALRADGCGHGQLSSALLGRVCLGVLGGFVHAAGAEPATPQSATVPAFALAVAAELELELSPRWSLAFNLSTTLLLHGLRVGALRADGAEGRSRALPRLGFALGLGPAYHFE